MTFRERLSKGNSQSQVRNSDCALATIVYAITDALRRSYRALGACRFVMHAIKKLWCKVATVQPSWFIAASPGIWGLGQSFGTTRRIGASRFRSVRLRSCSRLGRWRSVNCRKHARLGWRPGQAWLQWDCDVKSDEKCHSLLFPPTPPPPLPPAGLPPPLRGPPSS